MHSRLKSWDKDPTQVEVCAINKDKLDLHEESAEI
jgi:hypothetical protein